MSGVYQQNPDGGWTPATPIGWREEHGRFARLIFWLRGINHCDLEPVASPVDTQVAP